MKRSLSMEYVMMRANAEARNRKKERPYGEDLFVGLLKLSEVKAEDFVRAPYPYLKAVDTEIYALKTKFEKIHQVDTSELRSRLRAALNSGPGGNLESFDNYISRGEEIARERGADELFAGDLLRAIIENPTYLLMQVCDILNWDRPLNRPQEKEEPQEEKPREQEEKEPAAAEDRAGEEIPYTGGEGPDPDRMTGLIARIRKMRSQLLDTVQGQDHVVHAFAEGIFAAEVLAEVDDKRQRPRAIFAFVGPPGVGKTFLAEQGAQALELPFKRFDMSVYADPQGFMNLVGYEKSYKDAKPGVLTGFVAENPHSILLFDEIEKADRNTIQLFLQVLDAGRLTDRFLDTDVSFRDTIIIFTSNAGRSLYEGDARRNAAGVPRKTLIGALETEKDPRTGQPFFPAAITSRLATGWPLLFNHLEPHDLEVIIYNEFDRFCCMFVEQYGCWVDGDDLLPTALLFREGGAADARTLRAQAELFFKNEVFKLFRLWEEGNAPEQLEDIIFEVETDSLTPETRPLFFSDEKPEVLIYGDPGFAVRCRQEMPEYIFYDTQNTEEALQLAGEKDIRLVLLDITEKSRSVSDFMATVYDGAEPDSLLLSGAFDFAPMAAGAFRDGSGLFRALRERLPELPVYLLETGDVSLDEELTMSFVRAGARGKLTAPEGDFSTLEKTLARISRELYLQSIAGRMASERKVLYFETAPKLSKDRKKATIRLRDFSLKRAPAAEDAGSVLDEVEKPDISFEDVIGASDAKTELKFFIDYLKNPKKFTAQGMKPPKGVLLYGPPGTGKTMLAKAMAGESDVAFIPAVASAFVTKWQGSGPESVRKLFERARRYAPSILFIDEIDAVGRKRGESISAHGEEMALNALLTEMDGFSVDPRRPVFVLAATNFDVEEGQGGMGVLDPALVRRFDRRVLVDLPNAEEREQLLRMLLEKTPTEGISDEMIRRTAQRAMGMSPANLTGVVEQANRMAFREGKPVDEAILDEAFELTRHGEKKDWGYEYLERVARHESGHAFLCYLGGNTPSYLTIVARGGHGGYMEHSAKEMGPLSTKAELMNRIRTSLAGRASEIVYYGEEAGVSTGASGDLEQATRMAAAMLCSYGMDEEFGLIAMDPREALKDPAFRKRVNEILGEEMRNTIRILQENRPRIDRLVEALMQKNKLTGEEMEELLAENA